MASVRQLLFGQPPFKFMASHLAQDEDFLADGRFLLSISDADFSRVAIKLGIRDDFLSTPVVRSITDDALGEGEQSEKLSKIIMRVGHVLHDADMPANKAMDVLGKAIEKRSEALSVDERQKLVKRFRVLIAEPLGLARQFKAERLVAATGAELDKVRVVCDMRPVFDAGRESIEGVIPLAVLRIEYTTVGQDSQVVEMRVTKKQLEEIQSLVTAAIRKLEVITDHLQSQNVTLPETKATLGEEE